ncbi:MAG: hypothetical protein ABSH20_03285 [Tepidisphaeraceae bacterium]|jgi:hypothetical protein
MEFCMLCLNLDGTLDTTFGSGGKAVVTMGSGGVSASEMTLDSSGNITLVGAADGNVAIARFTASGSLDTSFNCKEGGSLHRPPTKVIIDTNGNVTETKEPLQ